MCAIAPNASAGAKPITKCKTITKPGFYRVKKDLTATGGDCLTIKASGVTLSLNAHNLLGKGTGIGIHVVGDNCAIDGLTEPSQNQSTISNFAIGIQVDGKNADIDNFSADGNSDTGILINGASSTTLSAFSADDNTNHGVHLLSSTGTVMHNYGINSNGIYGIWVDSSTNSLICCSRITTNGNSGIFLGCSGSGPGGTCLHAPIPSSFNEITHLSLFTNGTYGIAIDNGNDQNDVNNLNDHSNANIHPGFDRFDGNSNCANNLWYNNDQTGTANGPCDF